MQHSSFEEAAAALVHNIEKHMLHDRCWNARHARFSRRCWRLKQDDGAEGLPQLDCHVSMKHLWRHARRILRRCPSSIRGFFNHALLSVPLPDPRLLRFSQAEVDSFRESFVSWFHQQESGGGGGRMAVGERAVHGRFFLWMALSSELAP